MSDFDDPLRMPARPLVAVIEDDPTVAAVAAEVCRGLGAETSLFASPTPFLRAFTDDGPRAVILDWRLERSLGAAAFLAIRHRFPKLPVVCWTASSPDDLPAMLRDDPLTRVVGKATALADFEAAVGWALGTNAPLAASVTDGA